MPVTMPLYKILLCPVLLSAVLFVVSIVDRFEYEIKKWFTRNDFWFNKASKLDADNPRKKMTASIILSVCNPCDSFRNSTVYSSAMVTLVIAIQKNLILVVLLNLLMGGNTSK